MASGISGLSGLNSDYLSLLVSELQNQDPLNPTSNTEFISQLAGLGSLSQLEQLNSNFLEITSLIQITQGSGLIGKTVDVTDSSSGSVITGEVTSIIMEDGIPKITVSDQTYDIDQIQEIY